MGMPRPAPPAREVLPRYGFGTGDAEGSLPLTLAGGGGRARFLVSYRQLANSGLDTQDLPVLAMEAAPLALALAPCCTLRTGTARGDRDKESLCQPAHCQQGAAYCYQCFADGIESEDES